MLYTLIEGDSTVYMYLCNVTYMCTYTCYIEGDGTCYMYIEGDGTVYLCNVIYMYMYML